MSSNKIFLEDICDVLNGYAFDSSKFSTTEGYPLIRIRDLKHSECSLKFNGSFDKKYIVKEGDLLVGMDGEFEIFEWQGEPSLLNQRVCKLTPKDRLLDKNYLLHRLKAELKAIEKNTPSTTVKHISSNQIISIKWMNLPNYDEQKRIGLSIHSQLKEIEKARKAALVKRHDLQSISIKQQRKALEILGDLPRVPLNDFLEGIEAGKSIKTSELPAKKDEVGVLKVSAVSWDRFQPDEAKSVIGNYMPREEHRVKKGDLIISRANTLELVGAVVLVENDYPNRLLSDKTLRLILKDEKMLPEYLLHILKMSEARKHIEEKATGSSNSMRNISQKAICTIPIPKAHEKQQRQIIDLMRGTRIQLNKMNEALKVILEDLNVLPKKLLEEAFN